MKGKKPLSLLARGLLLYGAVLALLLAAFPVLLRQYVELCELCDPRRAAESYLAQLDAAHVRALADALPAQSDDDADHELYLEREFLPLLDTALSFRRTAAESDAPVYTIFAGETPILRIGLEPCGEEKLGLRPWRVASEELLLSFPERETTSVSVTVPEGCTVLCGGRPLGESELAARTDCAALSWLSDAGWELPKLVTYTASGRPDELALRVLDASGRDLDVSKSGEELLLDALRDAAAEEDRGRLARAAESFCAAWTDYLGSTRERIRIGYFAIRALTLPGSELDVRLHGAYGGMFLTQNRKTTLESFTPEALLGDGAGRYCCCFRFTVLSQLTDGPVTTELGMRVFFVESDGQLLAESVQLY